MKKYLAGTLAVIVALGLAAFNNKPIANEPQDEYYFAFNTGIAYSDENVENEANWAIVANANSCTGSPQKACVVRVPESLTVAGTPRTLSSSANLNATEYMETEIFLVSSAATGVTIYNKAQ